MNDPRMHEYLQQVSDAHPCGEDMAYSTLFDDIREARRADDSSLVALPGTPITAHSGASNCRF